MNIIAITEEHFSPPRVNEYVTSPRDMSIVHLNRPDYERMRSALYNWTNLKGIIRHIGGVGVHAEQGDPHAAIHEVVSGHPDPDRATRLLLESLEALEKK
jgi:hypothetical protein